MSDGATRVFISYSRKDRATAETLRERLIDARFEAFLDTHDIAPGEEWKARLRQLVEQADVAVFLISPDSVTSEFCDWEVNEAERIGKRVCPAVIRATPDDAVPPRLARLQFTFLETPEKDAAQFPRLVEAIRQDAVWVREHSRLGELALRWDRADRPSRLLMRGADIAAAEGWRASRTPTAPELTALHNAYLDGSRRGATRRLRGWVAGSALIALLTAGLAVFAVIQQQAAVASAEEADRQRAAAVAAQEEAEESEALTRAAIDSVIFEIAQGLENIEGVSPAAIRRILGQVDQTTATLLARDPESAGLRRSRAAMLSEFGDVYLRTGDVERAAAAYEESLAINRALAAAEPENTRFQREVSVSLNKVGDLRLRRGEADAALAAYEQGLQIARALAAAEPENTLLQSDVSVSLYKVGDVHLRLGERNAALAAYEEGLQIARALAASEPENVEAQTDVVVSLYKTAQAARGARKRELLQEALVILQRLEIEDVLSEDQRSWSALILSELRELEGAN